MYKLWRKITKFLAYTQEMNRINLVFLLKNSLKLISEGENRLTRYYSYGCILLANYKSW